MKCNSSSPRIIPFVAIVLGLASASPSNAEDPSSRSATRESAIESPVAPSPHEDENRLTKNWGGFRKTLSEKGVDLAVIYKGQLDSVRAGGITRGSTTTTNLDARLSLDFDKMFSWTGGSAFFYWLSNHGAEFSPLVGDLQVTSNIEAPADTSRIYEAWIQQLAFDDQVSFLLGLHDLNSEFYVTDTSTLFFNSSFGVGKELSQTGARGPSIFPATSMAFRVRTEPSKSFYLQLGVFDAIASDLSRAADFRLRATDGTLVIGEMAYQRGLEENSMNLPAKFALGYWSWSSASQHQLAAIDSSHSTAVNQGFYMLADVSYSPAFSVFVRSGIAAAEPNVISGNTGMGAVYRGLIPGRPKDRLGFAFTRADFSNEYLDLIRLDGSDPADSEITWELSYRIEVLPGFALQPDFQHVRTPGGSREIPNASILSARAELSF